jgi:phosphate transport system substrate-binding protein
LKSPSWASRCVWRLIFVTVLLAATGVLLSGCKRANVIAAEPVTLRVAGSTSMARALSDLATAYEASHSNVVVDLQGGGSSAGIQALTNGRADIAAVSWHPNGTSVPDGVQALPIARDAVAIIVNPKNTIRGLTLLQVKALYQGEALDWAAVGGAQTEPMIISREDGSGTRSAFEAMVMGGDRVTLNAVVMPGSQAVVSYVAGHQSAVGYVTAAELDDSVRAVAIEDVMPTPSNVRAGKYHLTRVLYLFIPASPAAAVRSFTDFVLSPPGQTIIARHHLAIR